MSNYGLIRVAVATIETKVGDCSHNTNQIIKLASEAINDHIKIIVFPELSITGYTCGDLFMQNHLMNSALKSLIELKHFSNNKDLILIVGVPIRVGSGLFNCAAFVYNGKILGLVPKNYMPTYNEFYEHRWFANARHLLDDTILIDGDHIPIGSNLIFTNTLYPDLKIGMEICEDLWTPIPPSTILALQGATLIANLSASNELVSKIDYRKQLLSSQSARNICGYLYASSGYGESTTDVVYGGHCLIYENGSLLTENTRFNLNAHYTFSEIDINRLINDRIKMTTYRDSTLNIQHLSVKEVAYEQEIGKIDLSRNVDPHPFVPSNKEQRDIRCEEIFSIQTMGLTKRLAHIGCKKVVLGISGGLDSTLALLVCSKTFENLGLDKKNIIGVTMPGFGTTGRTYQNALQLIEQTGATLKEISIKKACSLHFNDIGHDESIHDITFENVQARERTQILMDLSNKENGIVIGTGDLSELALGWATYNGDHMSMYGVNVSIPKTLVRYLVEWVANHTQKQLLKHTLEDILLTPVSPELLPPNPDGDIAQKTEEVVGPYELHDFFLYYLVRFGFTPSKILFLAEKAFTGTYSKETILHWLKIFYKRFFSQQFKRSCLPDGPKVGSICLSPRGDWRMPSDAVVSDWIADLENMQQN